MQTSVSRKIVVKSLEVAAEPQSSAEHSPAAPDKALQWEYLHRNNTQADRMATENR